MARARFVLGSLSFALPLMLGGYFEDPPIGTSATGGSGSESDTGGETCPDGSAGCACYGNSTCDAGLECVDDICKPPECVPGSLNCECYEGACFSGLECLDGVCKPEQAMPGCEATADCDDNLCTQGDELCAEMCVAGVEVQCPIDATCDPKSGSCACSPGTKLCVNTCIPETQCCTDTDCGGDSICQEGACTCNGGLVCNGECVAGIVCCPGEMQNMGCTCGAVRTCGPLGQWGSCAGGNPNPECTIGQSQPCGNCGSRNFTAQCTWSGCGGEGVCSPGSMNCTSEHKLEICTNSCYWQQQGTC